MNSEIRLIKLTFYFILNLIFEKRIDNYFSVTEHYNCSESLEDFEIQTPMQQVKYSNKLDLGEYTRYMRIGYK